MVCRACQWFGVAMEIASMDLSSRILRISWKPRGAFFPLDSTRFTKSAICDWSTSEMATSSTLGRVVHSLRWLPPRQKVRAVRDSICFRPKDESFYDFQINLLLWALGRPWYDGEMAKPLEERHIILRWRHERCELLKAHQKPGDDPNKPVAAPMTGNVKALQVLADDIYQLEHALKTPRRIIDRLRDLRQFQGVLKLVDIDRKSTRLN